MPVQIACVCRRVLQIPETLRAPRIQCPGCGRTLDRPQPAAAAPAPTKSAPKMGIPVTKTARGVAPPPPARRPAPAPRRSYAVPIVIVACLALPLLGGVLFLASLGGPTPETTVARVDEEGTETPELGYRPVAGVRGLEARDGSGRFLSDEGQMPLPTVQGADEGERPGAAVAARPNPTEEENLSLLRDRVRQQELDAAARVRRLEELRAIKKARDLEMRSNKAEWDALQKSLPSDVLRSADKRIENERKKVVAARSAADTARQREFEEMRAANRRKADALVKEGMQRMAEREYRSAADAFASAKMLVPYDDDVELLFREALRMERRENDFDNVARTDRGKVAVQRAKVGGAAYDEERDRGRANDTFLQSIDEQDERSAVLGRVANSALREQGDRAAADGQAQDAAMRAQGERAAAAGQAQMGAMRAQGMRSAVARRGAKEALRVEGMRAGWANQAQMDGIREQGRRARAAGRAQGEAMVAQDQRLVGIARRQNEAMREQGQRFVGAALMQNANLREQGERIVVVGQQQDGALRAQGERVAGAGREAVAGMREQADRSAILGREANGAMREQADRTAGAGRQAAAGLREQADRASSEGRAARDNIRGQTVRAGAAGGNEAFEAQGDRSRQAGREANEGLQDRPGVVGTPVAGRPAVTEERQEPSAEAKEFLEKLRREEERRKRESDARKQREEHDREMAALKAKKSQADKEEDELKRLEAEIAQSEEISLKLKAVKQELGVRESAGGATKDR